MRAEKIALLIVVFCVSIGSSQTLTNPREGTWSTNGTVKAIARVDQKVYIGGNFDYVGPYTGASALLDSSLGTSSSSFPRIYGTVKAAVPDGKNGWFIGGQFSQVGSVPCENLVHVLSNNSVDVSWMPSPDGNVLVLCMSGTFLYVGGTFNNISGAQQKYVACINAATGSLKTSWKPGINGSVNSISLSGAKVYLGGAFDTANGQRRNRLACLDTSAGSTAPWNPNPLIVSLPTGPSIPNVSANSSISAVSVSGPDVFIGGAFDTVGGKARKNIAAVDTALGEATSWGPNANGMVSCITVNGSSMYVGGNFSSIGNQARNFLACFDLATGNLTNWNPGANYYVFALSCQGGKVYAGGYFKIIGGKNRNNIACLDSGSGLATGWDPNAVGPNAGVFALSARGASVYAGGTFGYIGGKTRNHLACIDAVTGKATVWDPNASAKYYTASVNALSANGSFLYVGGAFDSIGGRSVTNIACLDTSTGLPTGWNPAPNNLVYTIFPSGTFVYVGGDFDTIDGQPRTLLACLDSATGAVTSWNPSPIYSRSFCRVFSLSVAGSDVYVGGIFDTIGGKGRYCLACLDAATGLASDWDPNPNGQIKAISVKGDGIYVGGDFTTIGGALQIGIACIDRVSSKLTNWRPWLGGGNSVYAMYLGENKVFEGGDYHAASIGAATGVVTWCDPQPDGDIFSMAGSESCVFIGGYFSTIAGINHPYYCQFGDYVVPVSPYRPTASPYSPAPFNCSIQKFSGFQTRIRYSLSHDARVLMQVFDMRGKILSSVVNSMQPAGEHVLSWPFNCRTSGLYLLKFQADDRVEMKIVSITR